MGMLRIVQDEAHDPAGTPIPDPTARDAPFQDEDEMEPEPLPHVLSERKVINKYTLVPVGLVVLAIAGTAGLVSWYYEKDAVRRNRIISVEQRMTTAERQISELRSQLTSINTRLSDQKTTLGSIDKSLAVIQYRLGDAPRPLRALPGLPTPGHTPKGIGP